MDIFVSIVAFILLALPIIDWTASIILHRASSTTHNIALKERARMATVLAIATTLNGVIALNRIAQLHFDSFIIIVILSVSLILVSVPNMYWLSLYLRSRFRK